MLNEIARQIFDIFFIQEDNNSLIIRTDIETENKTDFGENHTHKHTQRYGKLFLFRKK